MNLKQAGKIGALLFLFSFLPASILTVNYFFRLSESAGQPPSYFFGLIRHSLFSNRINDQPINLVLLGLDPRHDWLENTEATDTIVVVNIQAANAKISSVSLPRDLWNYRTKAKINDIYQSFKAWSKTESIPDEFSFIVGQDIKYYLVVDTQDLVDVVKLIGGVDVVLDRDLIDSRYPNPEYINQVGSSAPPYITIEFPAGTNHLDENNVAQFIRSRKSSDDLARGGTDLGRIRRQQLLLNAIVSKISTTNHLADPANIAKLYHLWRTGLESNIPDQLISDLFIKLLPQFKTIRLISFEIPISSPSAGGVIYHPNIYINNQWVFLPLSPDYADLQRFIDKSFDQ